MKRFSTTKTLLVEGQDDKNFIESFLHNLAKDNPGIDRTIYIHQIGGNGNIASSDEKSLLLAAEDPAFKINVKHLAILFDGDGNQDKAFKRVEKDISKINEKFQQLEFFLSDKINQIDQNLKTSDNKEFNVKTFIFLFEEDLENAFLKSVSKDDKKILEECVLEFFECTKTDKINNKKRVQALLSTKPEVRDIGSAAKKGLVDFDHKSFSSLKNFLLEFSQL